MLLLRDKEKSCSVFQLRGKEEEEEEEVEEEEEDQRPELIAV